MSNNYSFVDTVKMARSYLKDAQRKHHARVSEAKRILDKANGDYKSNIQSIEDSIKKIKHDFYGEIGMLNGSGTNLIALYGNRVELWTKKVDLTANTVVTVTTSPCEYRTIGGEYKLGSKAFIIVENEFGQTITFEGYPNEVAKANEFRGKINHAISTYNQRKKALDNETEKKTDQLEIAKEDTSEIESAKRNLQTVESDTEDVMLAEKALNGIIAKATPEQIAELEKADKRERVKKYLIVGGILLVLFIVIFFVNRT